MLLQYRVGSRSGWIQNQQRGLDLTDSDTFVHTFTTVDVDRQRYRMVIIALAMTSIRILTWVISKPSQFLIFKDFIAIERLSGVIIFLDFE